MSTRSAKTHALLRFLKDLSTLRRTRVAAYGTNDKILWLADVPADLPDGWQAACRSVFFAADRTDMSDVWLEVHKKREPAFPAPPPEVEQWIPPRFKEAPFEFLGKSLEELANLVSREIRVLVEKPVGHSGSPDGTGGLGETELVPEVRRLEDHPKVTEVWREYLAKHWQPWAEQARAWRKVQDIYERVDFIRRRLEEAEERYEFVLGVGLLQWRDSTGITVERHLLTAPAEVTLDAPRGILSVGPAASFDTFRVELDMLDVKDRPQLDGTDLQILLEELDVRVWDRKLLAQILGLIANKARPDSLVDENVLHRRDQADNCFRVLYAPALILRERRPTAYGELVGRLLENPAVEQADDLPAPWIRFVSEGDPQSASLEAGADTGGVPEVSDTRLYFPLPTNEEQGQIVDLLRRRPYVLVKGPPGTGKSHTIANLICHLLARGERILVTAQAPKALTVLRDLLPSAIQPLCVTAFGSSREDQRILESSVRGILSKKNQWPGNERVNRAIEELEGALSQLEEELAEVDRELRECREAETHRHTLPGGYVGSAAQIARQVEAKAAQYNWFPTPSGDRSLCPLGDEGVRFLAETHLMLNEELLNELALDVGTFTLPDPPEFAAAVHRASAAEDEARRAAEGLPEELLRILQHYSQEELEASRAFIQQLEQELYRARGLLGDRADQMLRDVFTGQGARWDGLERTAVALVDKIRSARARIAENTVELSSPVPLVKLMEDVRLRLQHLKSGKWRGWGSLAPRAMRLTRYVEGCCRVSGQPPRQADSLEILLAFLELSEHLKQFGSIWPAFRPAVHGEHSLLADRACELVAELCRLRKFLTESGLTGLSALPVDARAALASPEGRDMWSRLLAAELARRRAVSEKQLLEESLRKIRDQVSTKPHPCMLELADAIEHGNAALWRAAWEKREDILKAKERLARYEELVRELDSLCNGISNLLRQTRGDPEWAHRLQHLVEAWDWAWARTWLRKVTDPEHYANLAERRRRLEEKIRRKIEELAAAKAWKAFFERLDDRTEQNLTAWTKAVARIGKGTGKYAYRHRRDAKRYLMECIPKIPAWIMPLHKVWENASPEPGVFGTVIVDEASQAGVEALLLMLLARRIIVVGDDKQNSPDDVGVAEDDIARLALDRLSLFHYRAEFRPDTSLYDHAERAFVDSSVSLREHFRCVPEIIRFSNDLCYSDAPLIPLRQPPPRRLPPLQARLVTTGYCQGDGPRIQNPKEAEEIVNTICECLGNSAYYGKTMGVIVLQGHAQAELIERMLAEKLDPAVRQERKLRCGVPATFQGDERDVIFLSMVAAPNHRHRALTGLADQRRFNVAMSRARDQVWLFHSVKQDDLSREDLRWRLLHFFYHTESAALGPLHEHLDRLEGEASRPRRQPGEQPEPYESWFEVDVALQLLRRKYRVVPQFEVAGYRIDLVVEGWSSRLAVECDGEAWHGPERFEQDMARQRQLERAGWRFVRVRESEFYADRESVVERILAACRELHIQPVGEENFHPVFGTAARRLQTTAVRQFEPRGE